jgi:hypothetical protein
MDAAATPDTDAMPRHAPLPSPFDTEPFRTSDALAHGIGRGCLRGRDLARPFPGVRVAASSALDAARAYNVRMPAHQFFSHWTAARIHGLPLPRACAALHVTAAAPHRAPRLRGVVGHSSIASEHVVRGGVRVATAVDTWVAMSTELTLRDLVVMGDALVRRHRPMATMAELEHAVARHHGRRGAALLTAAFALVRPRTDSVRETLLRLAIVDYGLPEPVVNHEIRDDRGRFIAWGDLAYPECRVLAEYDGDQHRTDEKQYFRDIDRLDDLAEIRWRTVRFNKSHITTDRLEKLQRALRSAGWQP